MTTRKPRAVMLAVLVVTTMSCSDGDGSVLDASVPVGAPVDAAAFCPQLAAIVCQTNDACCEGVTPAGTEEGCEARQTAACAGALGAYLDDPRVGYLPERGGAYLAELRRQAGECFAEPPSVEGFFDVFVGTGVLDADCTPRDATDDTQLRLSQASCTDGLVCHLYRRSDGSTQGICEPREDDGACSHRFDCSASERCNLPNDWSPGRWGDCQPLKTNGWDCADDLECASQYCDGFGTCAEAPATRYCDARTYDQTVVLDEPIGYWRFGDASSGGVARDSSRHGLDGRFSTGASLAAEGALAADGDGALALNGESSATLPEIEDLASGEGLTLELWFRRDEGSETGPLLEFFFEEEPGVRVWNHDAADRVHANLSDVDGTGHVITSGGGVAPAGEWVHVVATYDGSVMRLHANGESVGDLMESFVPDVAGIGQVGFREGDDRRIRGAIDEIAIYDRALGTSAIRAHYEIGRQGPADQTFPLFDWVR